MTKEDVELMVRDAVQAVMGDITTEIAVVSVGSWTQRGPWQAVVMTGNSRAGYHVGLCVRCPGGGELMAWSDPLPTKAHLIQGSEAALEQWLRMAR